jgi:hypothetical protein
MTPTQKALSKKLACIQRRKRLTNHGRRMNARQLRRYMKHDTDVQRWKRVWQREWDLETKKGLDIPF